MPGNLAYIIYTSGSTGPAQGRAARAPGPEQPGEGSLGKVPDRARKSRAAVRLDQLRRLSLGDLLRANPRRRVLPWPRPSNCCPGRNSSSCCATRKSTWSRCRPRWLNAISEKICRTCAPSSPPARPARSRWPAAGAAAAASSTRTGPPRAPSAPHCRSSRRSNRSSRSAGPSPISRFTFSMSNCGPCPSGSKASCISAASASRAVITTGRN